MKNKKKNTFKHSKNSKICNNFENASMEQQKQEHKIATANKVTLSWFQSTYFTWGFEQTTTQSNVWELVPRLTPNLTWSRR